MLPPSQWKVSTPPRPHTTTITLYSGLHRVINCETRYLMWPLRLTALHTQELHTDTHCDTHGDTHSGTHGDTHSDT